MTLFLEKARGASALVAGIQMLPIMGVFAFVNYYAGRASAVWSNRRTMIIGYGTAAMGAASTILVGGAAPYWLLAITLVVCNLGLGLLRPRKGSHHGRGGEAEDVQRLSPLLLDHVNVLGRYEFALKESIRQGQLRPLREPKEADDLAA